MLINVKDVGNLQIALDLAQDGDRIYLPARGTAYAPLPPNKGWTIKKSVEIFGDGPGLPADKSGTTLAFEGFGGGDLLAIGPATTPGTLGPVFIHDLKLQGMGQSHNGIVCAPAANQVVTALRLERVVAVSMTQSSFAVNPSALGGIVQRLTMINCYAVGCTGVGVLISNVKRTSLLRCGIGANSGGGMRVEATPLALRVVSHENDGQALSATQGELQLVGCQIAHVESSRFEKFSSGTKKRALEFTSCGGAALLATTAFVSPDAPHATPPDPQDPPPTATGVIVNAPPTPPAPYSANPSGPIAMLATSFIKVWPTIIVINVNGGPAHFLLPAFSNTNAYNPQDGLIDLGGTPSTNTQVSVPFIAAAPRDKQRPAGLTVPVRSTPPTVGVQSGVLYYDSANGLLKARIGTTWKRIVTHFPP